MEDEWDFSSDDGPLDFPSDDDTDYCDICDKYFVIPDIAFHDPNNMFCEVPIKCTFCYDIYVLGGQVLSSLQATQQIV